MTAPGRYDAIVIGAGAGAARTTYVATAGDRVERVCQVDLQHPQGVVHATGEKTIHIRREVGPRGGAGEIASPEVFRQYRFTIENLVARATALLSREGKR